MYAQQLANQHASPASLKNYISGARHWITAHLGDPSAFSSQTVQEVVSRLTKISTHIPAQAAPIGKTELKIITQFLDGTPNFSLAIKPCVLISFACMFRSSNAVSPSTHIWGGAHTLRACDVIPTPTGLDIIIHSTKTTSACKPVALHIDQVMSSDMCPVSAWNVYYSRILPPLSGPAFINIDRSPLTASPVVSAIKAALKAAGYMNVSRYSIHSLRRGAAQMAASMGAPSSEIMKHGIWASHAGLRHYVHPVSTTVPRLLARGLAD